MSFAKVYSAQPVLLNAEIIDIEVDLSKGLYAFSVVGLPDKAVEESKDRVSAAIKNTGFKSPKQKNQKIVVSLAPADLKKEGPIFDLPTALAYLLAADEIKFDPNKKLFIGELSLNGALRRVNGVLPLVTLAKKKGFSDIFVPKDNAREAALISDIKIFGVESLQEVIAHLDERRTKENSGKRSRLTPWPKTEPTFKTEIEIDFADIKGQAGAKRGLLIAAAGGHNIAMYGPPGTGKTLMAKAFAEIIPPLAFEEMLEVTGIHSIAGTMRDDLITKVPWRSPHHTSSYVSIVGGGAIPKPGEVTLAHRGILFLDEFPEFDRKVIDTLREPLEERIINVSRAKGSARFPANFILIAAMNPCPCGNYGIKGKQCSCSPANIERYKRKLSGPIIDRIDIWVEVSKIDHQSLGKTEKSGESSEELRAKVVKAREVQINRFKKLGLPMAKNSEIRVKEINKIIPLADSVKKILDRSAELLDLSARSYHKILKLSRTIADLEGGEAVTEKNILEALQYRPKRAEL
jgi:magnesium chelatase family protein